MSARRVLLAVALAAALAVPLVASQQGFVAGDTPSPAPAAAEVPAFAKADPGVAPPAGSSATSLPVWFEPNLGQAPAEASFVVAGGRAWATPDGLVLDGAAGLRLSLPHAVEPVAEGRLASYTNYLSGAEPIVAVPHYQRLLYEGVAPGIDLVAYDGGALEFDLVLQPGADLAGFALRLSGHDSAELQTDGSLLLEAAGRTTTLRAPQAYQEWGGERHGVESRFALDGDILRLESAWPRPDLPLTVDPQVIYGSYMGGSSSDYFSGVAGAPDERNHVYLAGYTYSTDLPAGGSVQTTNWGNYEGFVAKFDTSKAGQQSLLWVSYLGGYNQDKVYDIDAEADGVYVVGSTWSARGGSPAFPVTSNAYQQTGNTGGPCSTCSDMFLTKIRPDGQLLLYSTLLGGTANEEGAAVEAASDGTVVVAGWTDGKTGETQAPTKSAFQPGLSTTSGTTNMEGIVARFDTTKSGDPSLLYSTFLGGTGADKPYDIDLDDAGNAYVMGQTTNVAGAAFPVSASAFQPANAGSQDAFLAKIPSNGGSGLGALPFSTLYGGPGAETPRGIDYANGKVWIVGHGYSTVPVTTGAYKSTYNSADYLEGWIAKFDPAASGASQLQAATYVGGKTGQGWNAYEMLGSIQADDDGNVWVAGTFYDTSSTFPMVNSIPNGGGGQWDYDYLLARFDPNLSEILSSTRIGSQGYESAHDWYWGTNPMHALDLTTFGDLIVGGWTMYNWYYVSMPMIDFPGTPAYRPTAGYDEAWVLHVMKTPPTPSCRASPPLYREVPITFSAKIERADAPVDPTSWKWWFDTAVSDVPNAPDASGSDTATWTFPKTVPAGEHTVRVQAKDTSGKLPDTGSGFCTITLVNTPPVAKAFATTQAKLGVPTVVTGRLPGQESFDPDGNTPWDDLQYYWALPIQEACEVVDGEPWNVECMFELPEPHQFLLVVVDPDGGASYANLTLVPSTATPVARITSSATEQTFCGLPPDVELVDASIPAATSIVYRGWDLDGDGQYEKTGQHVTWQLPGPGTHTAKLLVRDLEGRADTATFSIVVQQLPAPDPQIRMSQLTTYPGLPIHFEDQSEPGAVPLVAPKWDLGDGTILHQARFAHAYAAPGLYTVTLEARDQQGCHAERQVAVRILEVPVGDGSTLPVPDGLDARIIGPKEGRPGEMLRFLDASVAGSSPIRAVEWDFGDGSGSTEGEAGHRYSKEGTYTVTLLVEDKLGRQDTDTLEVRVAAVTTADALLRGIPVADAGPDLVVDAGSDVRLDGSGSRGDGLRHTWEQLAGPTVSLLSDGAAATFRAPQPGDVLVFRLTVSDGVERSQPDQVTVRVVEPRGPGFDAIALGGGAYLFSSRDGGDVTWDFGDGQSAEGATARHTFLRSGEHTVTASRDGAASEQSLDVDTRAGLAARPAPNAALPELRYAALPVGVVLGGFLVAAMLVGTALALYVRRRKA